MVIFNLKIKSIFKSLKNLHSGRTNPHSHQQCMRIPFSPHPRQHLLSPVLLIDFISLFSLPLTWRCNFQILYTIPKCSISGDFKGTTESNGGGRTLSVESGEERTRGGCGGRVEVSRPSWSPDRVLSLPTPAHLRLSLQCSLALPWPPCASRGLHPLCPSQAITEHLRETPDGPIAVCGSLLKVSWFGSGS